MKVSRDISMKLDFY